MAGEDRATLPGWAVLLDSLPPPHLGLSRDMSPLHLCDFCIQPQGNRDEGPENLTQAHEDAKVRPILAVLLRALHQKTKKGCCMPWSGIDILREAKAAGQGLCNCREMCQVK